MTMLELATGYLNRGWQPIPIKLGSKDAGSILGKGWPHFHTAAEDLSEHFNGRELNIGILLGEPSGDLVDIDLDTSFAQKIAPAFLPPTGACFGRPSSPRSHYLFRCVDPFYKKYNNPLLASSPNKADRDRACLVEFRGKEGLQSIVPGSVHGASGERIKWAEDGEPAEVGQGQLKRATGRIAAAALICEFWKEGVRNELTMALSGGLLRNGWQEEEVESFIKAICRTTADEETERRLDTVKSTNEKLAAGEHVTGFPKLAELTDPRVVTAVCKWLEIDSKSGVEAKRPVAVVVDVTPFSGDAAALLDSVERFIGRFVSYPSVAARIAHTLWIAHTWLMDKWDSTPRLAFLSPEPASGKSRGLEVTEPLVPRAVHAVNTTPAYLFRKVSDETGPPTILYDEIDTLFGPKAKDNEEVRGMLNAGHRRGATAGRCVARGATITIEELPAYCAVALAGLDDLPDTLMTRSVVVRMRRRSPNENIEPWRLRKNGAEAEPVRRDLEAWAAGVKTIEEWPEMPAGVEDRNADVWEALLAVADLAGGHWPKRAREAAVTLIAASQDRSLSLGIQLLIDLKIIFGDADQLWTDSILEKLIALPESPWGNLRGKPIDARGLSYRLKKYEVAPKSVRVGARVARGYKRADLIDVWERYTPSSGNGVTTATSDTRCDLQTENVTDQKDVSLHQTHPLQRSPENKEPVTHVADVTDKSWNGSMDAPSASCGECARTVGPIGTKCHACGEIITDPLGEIR